MGKNKNFFIEKKIILDNLLKISRNSKNAYYTNKNRKIIKNGCLKI